MIIFIFCFLMYVKKVFKNKLVIYIIKVYLHFKVYIQKEF